MAGPDLKHDARLARPRSAGALRAAGAALLMLASLAACHRPVPPNVTPPGETAAFSEPSPAASAAPATETPK